MIDPVNEVLISMRYQAWHPGLNYAIGCAHPSPGEGCHCGFNAYADMGEALNSEYNTKGCLFGAIAGAGQARIHRDGFRTSEAQVLALFSEDESQYELNKKVAERYGVPLFDDKKRFEEYVARFEVETEAYAGIPEARPGDEKNTGNRTEKSILVAIIAFLLSVPILGSWILSKNITVWFGSNISSDIAGVGIVTGTIITILSLILVTCVPKRIWDALGPSPSGYKGVSVSLISVILGILAIFLPVILFVYPASAELEKIQDFNKGLVVQTAAVESFRESTGKYPETLPEAANKGASYEIIPDFTYKSDGEKYELTGYPYGKDQGSITVSGDGKNISASCSKDLDDPACDYPKYNLLKSAYYAEDMRPGYGECRLNIKETFRPADDLDEQADESSFSNKFIPVVNC